MGYTKAAGFAMAAPGDLKSLLLSLYDAGAFILRDTELKSGVKSPFYVDLRLTVSDPPLLAHIANRLVAATTQVPRALLCGVPYTALPFATAMSLCTGVPMVMRRKERKAHGTGKVIEGVYERGAECLVVEDLVTSGGSVLETAAALRAEGIVVRNAVVLLDREQGARANLAAHGVALHAVTTVSDMVGVLRGAGRISAADANKVLTFVSASQVRLPAAAAVVAPARARHRTFDARAQDARSAVARRLFAVMEAKRSNLCVAADVTTREALLMLADAVGPSVAVLKTHADIVGDWDATTGGELRKLAQRHNFLVFEDRKYADIGTTAAEQLRGGVHRVGSWADFVNAHALPGPGIVAGLRAGGAAGVVLLAEMSSAGHLCSDAYRAGVVAMAEAADDLVFGFISQGRLDVRGADGFVFMTPGVKLVAGDGALGQQYNTPERAVLSRGSDVVIVGCGIYEAADASADIDRDAEKYKLSTTTFVRPLHAQSAGCMGEKARGSLVQIDC